ncbi:MAG: SHOCT domain-containing protein [Promethearchaeota archaeon]|jgi:uncharacterized membrane protein
MWCGFWSWGTGGMMWTWVFVLFGLGYLFWWGFRPQFYNRYREDPLDIARMRLARGEITPEDFEKIIKNL